MEQETMDQEPIERRVTRNSIREDVDQEPEPERRITRNSKRDDTLKSPLIRTRSRPDNTNRIEKRVQIEPIRKAIPIEDLWTEDEIKIARLELNKINEEISKTF